MLLYVRTMVVVTESSQGKAPSVSEAEAVLTQNGFLRFILVNEPLFDRLTQQNDGLTRVTHTWQNSLTLDSLTTQGVMLAANRAGFLPPYSQRDRTELEKYNRSIIGDFFDGTPPPPPVVRENDPQIETWLRTFNQLKGEFQAEIGLYQEELSTTQQETLRLFSGYLSSDSECFVDFAEFLVDDDFKEEREKVLPFLETLRQHESQERDSKKGILEQASKEVTDRLLDNPSASIIEKFLAEMAQDSSGKQDHFVDRDVQQWVRFLVAYAMVFNEHSTLADLSKTFPSIGKWPKNFKDAYARFVKDSMSTSVRQIRRRLPAQVSKEKKEYDRPWDTGENPTLREETAQVIILDARRDEPIREDTAQAAISTAKQISKNSYRSAHVPDEDINAVISGWANGLAEHDARMQADIAAILQSLRVRPSGEGVTKTTMQRNIDGAPHGIYSFSPSRRKDLKTSHPLTRQARVQFCILRQGGENEIVILDIGTHDQYERDLRHKRSS